MDGGRRGDIDSDDLQGSVIVVLRRIRQAEASVQISAATCSRSSDVSEAEPLFDGVENARRTAWKLNGGVLMHYSGRMKIVGKRSTRLILPGWAACCSGDRAEAIARKGNTTRDKSLVTCKACLKAIAAEIDGWEKYPEFFSANTDWNAAFRRWQQEQQS